MELPKLPEEISFLSPVPRDRHVENIPPTKRSDGQRPSRIIRLPPVAPEKKQIPDKRQLPEKSPQPRTGTIDRDCKTQLKLVDKDVATGRSYIKALDRRFRILKRNLQKAMEDCKGRRLEEASYKKEIPEADLQSEEAQDSIVEKITALQGSELVLRPPEPAVYDIEESNWGSVLNSIQDILPKLVDTNTATNYSNSGLQPACSFRYYNRGQRYGRRYGEFDSDYDSYNGYSRRHRGYGRRYRNNRDRYGYSGRYDDRYYDDYYGDDRYYDDFYGDSDWDDEYRRSPYGRRSGYDPYHNRRRYSRRGNRWLSSNKLRPSHNQRSKRRPRFRIKQHKYEPYEEDYLDDFSSASEEGYSKSSGFDSFSDRSYSGASGSFSGSNEQRERREERRSPHERRGNDRYERRRETDHYEGRDRRRYEDSDRETKSNNGCRDCHRRKYHNVSFRRYYNYPRSRYRYGGSSRNYDYYSDQSSFDTDMEYGYGGNRYRRYGRYSPYSRRRRYSRYNRGRYPRYGSRYTRRRYGGYSRSDSDYDSDSGSSSFDDSYRRGWSSRRYGGRSHRIPRYYVSTKCRPRCRPKAIEPSPDSKNDNPSKANSNPPPAKIEAITC